MLIPDMKNGNTIYNLEISAFVADKEDQNHKKIRLYKYCVNCVHASKKININFKYKSLNPK